jgi:ATP-binding cassette, subfamily B, bacterial
MARVDRPGAPDRGRRTTSRVNLPTGRGRLRTVGHVSSAFDRLLDPRRTRSLASLPRLVARSMRLVRAAAGATFARAAALQLAGAMAAAGQIYFAKELIDVLVADDSDLGAALAPIVGLVVVSATVAYAAMAQREYQRIVGELTARHATTQVLEVATAVDAVAFEIPEFHDRLRRAQINAQLRPFQLSAGVLGLIGAGIGVVAVGVTLAFIAPLFCVLLIVAAVPGVVANLKASSLLYRFEVRRTEPDRRRGYLFHVLGTKEHAAELRSFEIGEPLRSRHDALYDERVDDLAVVVARRLRYLLVGTVLSGVVTTGAFVLLVWSFQSGSVDLAGAGSAAAATLILTQRLQGLASSVSSLLESSLFVEDFTSFVDILPELATPAGSLQAPEDFRLIDVKRVSFRYPAATRDSVSDVSIELHAGEVVALVGENGSGKTTLAKMLAGLLAPSDGVIRWDGVDVTVADPRSVRDRVAVIYQDYVKFHLSAGENITLGRWSEAADAQRRHWAGVSTGIADAISSLPDGFDTQLGPEFFGGTDLSIGQWQRLALARAVFRDAPLVILDEPAAALDPRAEAELFADARLLFPGKTVLLITHRFASARSADRIYVLEGGRITESGAHDELLARRGLYAELFDLQARGYQERQP